MQALKFALAEPDEFGVIDGREAAGDLIAAAFRLIVPYVRGCPACADRVFSAIAENILSSIHTEAAEEGGLPCQVLTTHEPGELRRLMFDAHCRATEHETVYLLQKGDALMGSASAQRLPGGEGLVGLAGHGIEQATE